MSSETNQDRHFIFDNDDEVRIGNISEIKLEVNDTLPILRRAQSSVKLKKFELIIKIFLLQQIISIGLFICVLIFDFPKRLNTKQEFYLIALVLLNMFSEIITWITSIFLISLPTILSYIMSWFKNTIGCFPIIFVGLRYGLFTFLVFSNIYAIQKSKNTSLFLKIFFIYHIVLAGLYLMYKSYRVFRKIYTSDHLVEMGEPQYKEYRKEFGYIRREIITMIKERDSK